MSRREPIYTIGVMLGRSLFAFWRLRRTVTGGDNIPNSGGAVIAMTHFGYLEFALVEWMVWAHNRRRIRFLAVKAAFEKPIIGFLLRGMKHISVDMSAGAEAYASASTALRSGELVGVFPEAGVDPSFTIRSLKTGAVRLAAEAGVPIIPVVVWGGQRLLTKAHRVRWRDRFGVQISSAFGEPILVSPNDDADDVTSRLRQTLQRMLAELQSGYPADGAGQWWQPRHRGGSAPTPAEAAVIDESTRERRRIKREQRR